MMRFLGIAGMMLMIEVAMAVDHKVGWDTSFDFQTWASGRTVHEGDVITFQYSEGMHNVIEVPKSDYDSCQPDNLIKVYSDGNTVIALKTPAKRYFICGTAGHCAMGMKLHLDVLAAATPPPSSPSLSPPSPPSQTTPAASPTPNDDDINNTPEASPTPNDDDINNTPPPQSPLAPSKTLGAHAPAPSAALPTSPPSYVAALFVSIPMLLPYF